MNSPNPSNTQYNFVGRVSCLDTSFCMAVGGYINGTTYQTLIEKWNGSTWSLVNSPNTSNTQNNVLEGVSCVSATFCMADGDVWKDRPPEVTQRVNPPVE